MQDHGLILASKQDWKLVKVNPSPVRDANNEISNSDKQQELTRDGHISILMNQAQSVFELRQMEDPGDISVSTHSHYNEVQV